MIWLLNVKILICSGVQGLSCIKKFKYQVSRMFRICQSWIMLRFFNLWFLLSLLFILNSCLYTANSPPNKKLILQDDKRNYRQLYVSFFDSIEKIKKTANSYAPAGTYSYSYASAFNRDKSGMLVIIQDTVMILVILRNQPQNFVKKINIY